MIVHELERDLMGYAMQNRLRLSVCSGSPGFHDFIEQEASKSQPVSFVGSGCGLLV